MTYITRIANKRIYAFIAYKSIISIGNLAPVGRFSPAMPQFEDTHSSTVKKKEIPSM